MRGRPSRERGDAFISGQVHRPDHVVVWQAIGNCHIYVRIASSADTVKSGLYIRRRTRSEDHIPADISLYIRRPCQRNLTARFTNERICDLGWRCRVNVISQNVERAEVLTSDGRVDVSVAIKVTSREAPGIEPHSCCR